MSTKKAYLISCSDHYDHRLHIPDASLRNLGYETTYITSNFDHTAKCEFICNVANCIQLPTRPYQKNLSMDRILSHREFAKAAFQYIEALAEEPDMLVVLLPPNFLAYYAARYKKRHPRVKIVFDIFDLWPETFPGGLIKKLLRPAFDVWAAIRDQNLGAADFVVTECDMFREKLKLEDKDSKSIWLCAKPLSLAPLAATLREDVIELCYLGAINNIISIPDICNFIKNLTAHKPVILHIIGKGERQQEFVDEATAAGAEVIFYGAVYDDKKKQEIMSHCHFGLNIMKSSVCIGLTMKSVDYFRFGLPIINNIPADTKRLVKEKSIGVQLEENAVEKICSMDINGFMNMRSQVMKVFEKYFAYHVIQKEYQDVLDRLL